MKWQIIDNGCSVKLYSMEKRERIYRGTFKDMDQAMKKIKDTQI